MGTRLTVPAAVTPGMLRNASIMAFSFSSDTPPFSSTWLRSISASMAPCGWKPSGVRRVRTMPRTATSEAVTSSVQMAICTPSNRSPRRNRRAGVAASGGPLFIACKGLLRHTCRVGASPNTSALAKVKISPVKYTRASTPIARWP